MKNYVIILAAGGGNRFENKLPKQFIELGDEPVLMHTLRAFFESDIKPDIVLVLNRNYITYWKGICFRYKFDIPHEIVEGGKERFHSVKNALDTLTGEGYVGIHDGVRPFVTNEVIDCAFTTAHKHGNATPAVSAINTVRIFNNATPSRALNRSHVYIIQNPQVFKISEIKAAYKQPFIDTFTDDATVAENYGLEINLVPGDRRNIKITHRLDIVIAQSILRYNKQLINELPTIKSAM